MQTQFCKSDAAAATAREVKINLHFSPGCLWQRPHQARSPRRAKRNNKNQRAAFTWPVREWVEGVEGWRPATWKSFLLSERPALCIFCKSYGKLFLSLSNSPSVDVAKLKLSFPEFWQRRDERERERARGEYIIRTRWWAKKCKQATGAFYYEELLEQRSQLLIAMCRLPLALSVARSPSRSTRAGRWRLPHG
jgi:hypothetical protein